jgi:hypothetical protein
MYDGFAEWITVATDSSCGHISFFSAINAKKNGVSKVNKYLAVFAHLRNFHLQNVSVTDRERSNSDKYSEMKKPTMSWK